jgi:hypothetical protein
LLRVAACCVLQTARKRHDLTIVTAPSIEFAAAG